eukprot:CAMPEP_0169179148 /NCGR_PEP_ID=MMETSP1015-20121227/67487_1 /TAXON_ID=342587 /ORGANISM="Karlodinium micrum, Strain CCMP2283" /LENGTH=182 /DNA_ID=CAMNT_0009254179 /DNA_START=64 /DNA_END=612 /DNA_ORIENTATION=-
MAMYRRRSERAPNTYNSETNAADIAFLLDARMGVLQADPTFYEKQSSVDMHEGSETRKRNGFKNKKLEISPQRKRIQNQKLNVWQQELNALATCAVKDTTQFSGRGYVADVTWDLQDGGGMGTITETLMEYLHGTSLIETYVSQPSLKNMPLPKWCAPNDDILTEPTYQAFQGDNSQSDKLL